MMRKNANGVRRRAAAPTRARTVLEWLVMGVLALLVSGCSLEDLLGTEELPDGYLDPEVTETPKGALQAHRGTLVTFHRTFGNWVIETAGLLTDELQAVRFGVGDSDTDVDRRDPDATGGGNAYNFLNRVRGQAAQAIGLQKDYAPDSLAALTGHLYAMQAYAEIFLADLFCSGIPLSTLDYEGDYTFRPGSRTEDVYEHAIALLDTALTFTGDSVRFEQLARVGRARALLNLGRFADAAEAVADVPDDFRYAVAYRASSPEDDFANSTSNFARTQQTQTPPWRVSVSDREGVNGLDYRASGDPRAQASLLGTDQFGNPIYHPDKYARDGSSSIVLASGIEARLIEAEAALNAGDATWLDKLNHLRQTMWTTIEPAVAGPLPDLTDPGTDEARVDLLYRERAFWLFLTGQRQGDLRRLIRHYGRTQDQVYPTGPYGGGAGLWYGSAADLAVPAAEQVSNPYYDGCFSRS